MTTASDEQPNHDLSSPQSISTNIQGEDIVVAGHNNTVIGKSGVYVTGNVEGSITTGDIVYPPPPSLWQLLSHYFIQLLKTNRWLLILIIVLEAPLTFLFLYYKNRFLLSWWTYGPLALFLIVVAWSWFKLITARSFNRPLWPSLLIAIAISAIWGSLLGWQIQAALFPAQFSSNQFGIAVATFSEGPDFEVTSRSRQVSDRLYDRLDQRIKNLELTKDVPLTRIGVIQDAEQGRSDGERIRAKLVVWGQILASEDGTIIQFQVLRTANLTNNPPFPMILPNITPLLQDEIATKETNTISITQLAEPQVVAITAFSLGLYYYLDQNYKLAREQFEIAEDNLKQQTQETTLKPNWGLVYYYLGKSYQFLGDFAQSQAMLDRAAELNPEDHAVLLGQAYNYRVFGQTELQQQTLSKIITHCKKLPKDGIPVRYNCASAYEAIADDETALREYKAVIKINPQFFVAYLSAGRTLLRLNRLAEAEEMYRRAEDLAKDDPARQVWVYLDKGNLYEKKGKMKQHRPPTSAPLSWMIPSSCPGFIWPNFIRNWELLTLPSSVTKN